MVIAETEIWQLLEQVPDPEIPVISILDLGILRNVQWVNDTNEKQLKITITPTYSGCPAMDAIALQIRLILAEAGYKNVQIEYQLSPAWTTDWMSEKGKQKLKAYGIAPPLAQHQNDTLFSEGPQVPCPKCNANDTELISAFGATSCKALYRCKACNEPFDYFKCHR